ncbi:hypothetical protein B857_02081 [Solibacillus isronensis B3W22]|uniref:Tfp pilus assembly protein PilX n=1 Tax=Solibacillus isronensis B3W22 TaxID=1224748 RepID=K1LKV4_9BACL|nr:hypothetical protein [Solibacillus isronensis]AMO84026.1 hypothetical protein SOLI23_00090 [Solibacillus silvestris]EKB44959.1 hypothetical protein B857_02081 [Solibacillus isronensis B3W22]
MQKYLKNHTGSALLMAVAVLMLFTVLGLTLFTLTANGIKKNETRENIVQSKDLAEKGIDFAVNDIQKQLTDLISHPTIKVGKEKFKSELVQILSKSALQCPLVGQPFPDSIGYKIPGNNSSYTRVCIEKVEPVLTNGMADEKNVYKRVVTFKSIGYVNGKEHITHTKVVIGTDAVPDQLRYAVSTNEGGNLYLHGGIEVRGDIKTDGHLILSERAHWISRSSNGTETANWEDSTFLRMVADSKSINPKIIMKESGKYIYVANPGTSIDYFKHIENRIESRTEYLNTSRYTKYVPNQPSTTTEIQNKLFSTKGLSIVSRNLEPDKVEIAEKITPLYTTKQYQKNYNSGLTVTTTNHETGRFNPTDVIFIHGETNTRGTCKRYFLGFCIEYNYYQTLSKADFNINTDANSNSSNKDIKLSGTYYVNGNLKIYKTNLKSNAILYVDGDVTISDSTLNGIDANSTIFIFATGDISISNISVDHDTPSTIKGFFYSKQDMIMYGVGSNINLYGGLSAKRLILTAVRGKSGNNRYESGAVQKTINSATGLPSKNSRLKITYDEELISQYTEFKRDEKDEAITSINPPEILERY